MVPAGFQRRHHNLTLGIGTNRRRLKGNYAGASRLIRPGWFEGLEKKQSRTCVRLWW